MKRNPGFTLIELMVTVAVVGILAAIAATSYLSSVQKSRRATVQADLVALSQFMERTYTESLTYKPGSPAIAPTLPFTVSPQTGTSYYNITLSVITASSYTLRATATGSQASNGMLEIDSTGAKRWDADNSGGFSAAENVWK